MSDQKRQRRSYTPEYRIEAANLVIDTGRSIAAVAKEIGVGEQTLGTWVKAEKHRRHVDGEPTGALNEDERAELARLRRENFDLKQDNEFFGKSSRLLRVEASKQEKFELMDSEKARYAIRRMARLLEVTKSGYYAWKKRRRSGPSKRARAQRSLDGHVAAVHAESDGVYGAPRVAAQLVRQGVRVDEKTVAASLRRQGLEGISPRRFKPVTTLPGVATHHIPDLVKRVWDRGELDAVWISDITYLRTWEGFVYLCVIRDGCSRRVLGWAMDARQDSDLVERALRMAHTLREMVPDDVIFHADKGTQYTSGQLHQASVELGLKQSVGRTGVCWDNAKSESFWSSLKTEFFERRVWQTRAEAMREVARWIEVVYNRRRLHSALGMVPPVEFEEKYLAGQSAGQVQEEASTQAA
ncbi:MULTISPECIES: IS3 family transposase [unclassified Brevibacterium]|uniref:IS3 family transposase n=1 Tax=Brevibacterium sp. H-BE7 TaxID=1727208 RepID=UPI001E5B810A|nr:MULTISPECIES: IS3 family transposase [unclassified Brevibacterium]MDK8436601.1 IS3 family transposase [Brevibacterium sp. H-BE7]